MNWVGSDGRAPRRAFHPDRKDSSESNNKQNNTSTSMANLRTKILDFGGFDLSIILILRGGIPMPIGNSQESLSRQILVGIIVVGRLGVRCRDWQLLKDAEDFQARRDALEAPCKAAALIGGIRITANLSTKILDYRRFDASRILILRGGIPRPIGNFPESLSQRILVGID